MARRYADRAVRSVFLYVREAHPGEKLRHHTTMDDKRERAHAFKENCNVERQILLDDVEGTAHRGYGMLPNMTWIFGRGGVVHYKAAWTRVEHVEAAAVESLDALERRVSEPLAPYYAEKMAWRVRDLEVFRRELERSGPQATTDFFGPHGND